jgi:hypothetical protein
LKDLKKMKLSDRKRFKFNLDKLNETIQKENREGKLPYTQINPEWGVRLNGQIAYELSDHECGLVALEMVERKVRTPFGEQVTQREEPVPYYLRKEWCDEIAGFYGDE